jgi:hypothetical protein
MWLLYFSNAFESSLSANLDPYVSSVFQDHSLLPVISVVSSVMAGATYLPVAKILNLWDRTVGFLLMLMIATLGMILMAACNSFELYAAANVGLAPRLRSPNRIPRLTTICSDLLFRWIHWHDLLYRCGYV